MDPGKLFIGGISWDTNEESMREYFQTFGEVVEAVIMKDRTTGRARGFGFVVFSDPAVAERVVKEKHMIDGRIVEAKKAVPRDDQQSLNRSNGSIQGSPGPTRTKKIFVGGLASTVTEHDFKNYFDQFGTITDVVVMYDHNTQRPRGFGFITYDSEESVDIVLLKTFHELNGKMVEVKRAVPKESSPGPNRSQISAYNFGLGRVNSFLDAYTQGYNPTSVGGYGVRTDGRFSPVTVGRAGYPPFSPSSYNVGPNYRINGNFSSNLGYGRSLTNNMLSVAPNRYGSPVGYGIGGGGNASLMSSPNRNMWANGSQIYTQNSPRSGSFLASANGGIWGNPNANQGGNSSFIGGNLNYGNEENVIGYGRNGGNEGNNAIGYGRTGGKSTAAASLYGETDDVDIIGLSSFYAEPTWRSPSPELELDLEVPGLLGYGLGNGASDGVVKNSVGYSVANRSNRGIAA